MHHMKTFIAVEITGMNQLNILDVYPMTRVSCLISVVTNHFFLSAILNCQIQIFFPERSRFFFNYHN